METIAILSLILSAVVRLLKSDTKIPIDVPREYRMMLAAALGPVMGVIDLVAGGDPWHAAIATIACPLVAMAGHELYIETWRGGKEIPVPGMMK